MPRKLPHLIQRMNDNLQASEEILLEVAKAMLLLNHDRAAERIKSIIYGPLAQTRADMRNVRPKVGRGDY